MREDKSNGRGCTGADATDLQAIRQGDQQAYGRLMARHRGRVHAVVRKFTCNESVVEELTHEAFVEAFLCIDSLRSLDCFPYWLQRIASRIGMKHWRRNARDRAAKAAFAELMEDREARGAHGNGNGAKDGSGLRALLTHLEPTDRLIVRLTYVEGYTGSEIARRLGWSPNRVRVRLHRARKRLRSVLSHSSVHSEPSTQR